ncbi:MAG TPA: hypothetical protein DCE44_24945 [Verrucomicrobiales bacterium]|nr:hypothetical protein [Verrucomicrobiales bacterium]
MDNHRNESTSGADGAFEGRLSRLPMRSVPSGWRGESLAAANAIASTEKPVSRAPAAWLENHFSRFPVAWAGLAAIWVFILAANRTDRWLNGAIAYQAPRLSAEQVAALRAQRAELWALAGLDREGTAERQPADRPRDPARRPRSELRRTSDPNLGAVKTTFSSYRV